MKKIIVCSLVLLFAGCTTPMIHHENGFTKVGFDICVDPGPDHSEKGVIPHLKRNWGKYLTGLVGSAVALDYATDGDVIGLFSDDNTPQSGNINANNGTISVEVEDVDLSKLNLKATDGGKIELKKPDDDTPSGWYPGYPSPGAFN